jgi:hypothetical protein
MLGLVREQDVATRDFRHVTGLDTETQKALLEAKAKGSLDSRDIERYAPILREAPEEKRQETIEELREESERTSLGHELRVFFLPLLPEEILLSNHPT